MDPTRIEQTGVDGVGGAGSCDHFSIRGFVAEIRKKDPKIGWPFSMLHDQTSDEPTGFKPLTVAKFRRWDCHICLDKATNPATTTANEAPSDIQNAQVRNGTFSLRNIFKSLHARDKESLPGFHQLSEKKSAEKGLIQAVSSVNVTNGEGCPSADCSKDTDNYLIIDAATDGLQLAKASQCSYEGIQNPSNDKPANVLTKGEACHMGGDRNVVSTANTLEAVCCQDMVNAKSKETEVATKSADFGMVAGLAFIDSGACGEKDEQSVGEMGKMKEQCNKTTRETEMPLGNNIGIRQVDSQTAVTTHFSELDSKESDESEDEASDNKVTLPPEDTVKGRNAAKQLVISDGNLQHKRTRKVRRLDDIVRKERLHSFGKIHNSDGNEEANQIKDRIDRRLPALRRKDQHFGLEIHHTSPEKTKVNSSKGKRRYVDFENLEDQSALMYWIKKAREEAKTNKINTEAKHIDAAGDTSAENNLVDSLKVRGAKEHKQNAIECRMQSAVHQGCLTPQQENMTKKDIVIADGKATRQVDAKTIHSKSKRAVKSGRSLLLHGPKTHSNTNEEVTLRKKKKVHFIDNEESSQMRLPKGHKKATQERETTQTCEQDTLDDIPMDIVELLAKNQHERQLMEAKAAMVNTHNLSERTEIIEANHVLDVTKGHGDNVPGALHKNLSQRKSLWNNTGNSVWTAVRSNRNADESMKSVHPTSHGSKNNHTNLNQGELINATTGSLSPLQYKSRPSLSMTEVCHPQHHSWSKLWMQTSESCHKGQEILGKNTIRNAQGELSVVLNRTPFGIDTEKVNAHYSRMNMLGHNTFLREKPKTDALNIDYLKTMQQAKTHLQSREERGEFSTHNRSFPAVPSFAKIGNTGNSEMIRPQNLYTNETIPAMHLLRLMDSAKLSGMPLQDLPNRNYKGSLLESDLSSIHRCEKETIGLAPRGSSQLTNHSFMVQQYSQVQHQEFSCKPYRPRPRVGVYGSLLQKEITSLPDNSGTIRIGYSSKMTSLEDNRKDNSELSYSANQAGILNVQSPFSRNENSGRPFSVVNLNSNVHSGLYSARNHTMGAEISSKGAAVQPQNNHCEKEICVVNRNPADFTILDEKNEYMIESDDIWHTVPTSNKQCIFRPDGQRRKKARRVTASKGRMRS